eukprot:CAMPEP_0196774114 /NCGR_PEP_ID=MMETSP1104-20130614/3189_1 /TAXON_ID=33652 /ORGANISM="Cafeteria sp., Strain Caron Lab Isolate" /LENGTH=38 /DNA_ID= /DNA_START= /DNA_END= /DNA_ORIENTATION=
MAHPTRPAGTLEQRLAMPGLLAHLRCLALQSSLAQQGE